MLSDLDVAGFPGSWSLRHDRPSCQEAGTPFEVSESRNGPMAGARREGASQATPPPAITHYFPQPQPSHLHTSHVQAPPSQSGHRQSVHAQVEFDRGAGDEGPANAKA